MASEKRCLYEVLGLPRDCSPDEIRSAYKKLALQRHPDKLVQSGLTPAEATAQFQDLVHAYEVLSDPKERSWYDSHRSQILFSDPSAAAASPIPDLFSFFSNTAFSGYSDSGKGFYKVYPDLFYRIYSNEINFAKKMGLGLDAVREAPLMGNLESPYAQVTAFYNYWLGGFSTVMDFVWVDQYDVMAGSNRKSRRVMEEENKKLRKKAKREFNDTVRGLAEFVRKRDKRVIDMTLKKKEEEERKRAEEREKKKRMERARAYEEPEWVKSVEEEEGGDWEEVDGNADEEKEKAELYCMACGKKFKSEKQWKNHEQSKKHKEKIAALRETFGDEDEEEVDEAHADELGANVSIKDLERRFRKVEIDEEEEEEEGFYDAEEGEKEGIENDDGVDDEYKDDGAGDVDEETSVLEPMASQQKISHDLDSKMEDEILQKGGHLDVESDDGDFMRYDKRKSKRRSKGKKERDNKADSETSNGTVNGTRRKHNDAAVYDNLLKEEGHFPPTSVGNGSTNGQGDSQSVKSHKIPAQHVAKKGPKNGDANVKLKNSSKEKKAKTTAKNSGNACDTCGEDFESRNKLHKHLGETGHASLKYR